MERKYRINMEVRIMHVREYLRGNMTAIEIAEKLDTHRAEVMRWINRYKALGEAGFQPSTRSYPKELKDKIAREYLEGQGSYETLANKYDLSCVTILREWVRKYQGKIGNQGYMKDQKAKHPWKKLNNGEKKEIVDHCLENNKKYNLTSKKYRISYQQVVYLVKRYLEHGCQGLSQKRYNKNDLNENEKLKREIEKLNIELEIIKKKNEIEGKMLLAKRGKKPVIIL